MILRWSAALAAWVALVGGIPSAVASEAWDKPPADAEALPDHAEEGRAYERARRLSRSRSEHEKRLAARAARLDAERVREKEAVKLRSALSTAGRRDSYLAHERYWLQREVDALPRDPADLSAMARRGAFERELREVTTEQSTRFGSPLRVR